MIPWDNCGIMETSSLDLLYLERDPSTKEPSAGVRAKKKFYRAQGSTAGA